MRSFLALAVVPRCCCWISTARITTSSRIVNAVFRQNISRRRWFASTRVFSSWMNHPNLISSPKSNTVKKIQALLSKRKAREHQYGQLVVEGPRIVLDLLKDPSILFGDVLVQANRLDEYESAVKEASSVRTYKPNIIPVTEQVFHACSDTVHGQGILAIVELPQQKQESTCNSTTSIYLVIDGIADPGNLGTLLRSARAVGVAGVLLLPGSCDPWNPKAIRSAMGTTFSIPFLQAMDSWKEACSFLVARKCRTVYAAVTLDAKDSIVDQYSSVQYDRVDWNIGPTALVIGNEGNGISVDVHEAVTNGGIRENSWVDVHAIHVPMQAGVESLNAAICGSIILFESSRQHRNGKSLSAYHGAPRIPG